MKRRLAALVTVCLAAGLFQAGPHGQAPSGSTRTGTLAAGDRTLRSGEYYDEHVFEGQSGQEVTFDLTSTAFDPFLIVIAPSGDKQENDDFEDSTSRSRLDMTLSESGAYRVLVTSYAKEETGAYRLQIVPLAAGATGAAPVGRLESGELASGDRTLNTGEYFDEYALQGSRGQFVTLDLRSADFDPYLVLIGPGNVRQENDDYEGNANRSLVSLDLPADGAYRILVTSYEKGETGRYDLSILQTGAAAAPPAAPGGPRVERGSLAQGDNTLASGEFVDSFTFEGRPGQRVSLEVSSRAFDTYLILIPPRGERSENDDVEGRPGTSVIEADVTETGTYRVLVTSYEKGESGDYELRIALSAGTPAPPAAGGGSSSRDVTTIAVGESRDGELSTSDGRLTEGGEFRDMFAFDGVAGQQVVVELTSSAFDTYLAVIPPNGDQLENDDADGRLDLSRLEVTIRTTGRHRIMVTSYEAGETGRYRLTLRAGTAPRDTGPGRPPANNPNAAGGGGGAGRTYGLFVGISDYPGTNNDLNFTADDARRLREALVSSGRMREADSTMLLDSRATLASVRQAFQDLAGRAGPNDTFVFFYSGHGDRIERNSRQTTDPDNFDETLSLYDGDLTDDEMAVLFGRLRARVSLLVLDSCFSGGFSKDVITGPGQMGLFSSEEDVLSEVASKFRAGGYLSHFMAEGIGEDLADENRDRQITAIELRQYLHERFRSDVKASARDNFVRIEGPSTGYQHLVVDIGGVSWDEVLFRR